MMLIFGSTCSFHVFLISREITLYFSDPQITDSKSDILGVVIFYYMDILVGGVGGRHHFSLENWRGSVLVTIASGYSLS